MEFLLKKEINSETKKKKVFETVGGKPLSFEDIFDILKKYEDGPYQIFECTCPTFSESGNSYNKVYHSLEEFKQHQHFEGVNTEIHVVYINKQTQQYGFDVTTGINLDYVIYSENEKKREAINKRIEICKMFEDDNKKKSSLTTADEKQYQL